MGTIGESYAEGISKCECGCSDIVVEITRYLFVKRDKDLNITNEYGGDEEDQVITCRDCEKVLS